MSPSQESIEIGLEIQEAWKLENLEVWRLGGLEARKTGGLEARRQAWRRRNRGPMGPSCGPIERGLEIQEAWKLGNLEVWRLGGLEARKTGGLEARRPGILGC